MITLKVIASSCFILEVLTSDLIFQFPTIADIFPFSLAGSGFTSMDNSLVETVYFFDGGPNKLKSFQRCCFSLIPITADIGSIIISPDWVGNNAIFLMVAA